MIDPHLKTHPEFERLIQPLTTKELTNLREEILRFPDKRIVHVWKQYILYDKSVYDICTEHKLPIRFQDHVYDNVNLAAVAVCKHELNSQRLTGEFRKYLIGQWFLYQQQNESSGISQGFKQSLAKEIAKRLTISFGTVIKYANYAEAINTILLQDVGLAQSILLGKIKVSHENIVELSHLKPEEIRSIARSVEKEHMDHLSLSYIRNEVKWSHIQIRSTPLSTRERAMRKDPNGGPEIRQMPKYNPDAEVNSLCMTIDSWISSIQRVRNSESFGKISSKASLQLMKKLSFLEHTATAVQELLVERTNNE